MVTNTACTHIKVCALSQTLHRLHPEQKKQQRVPVGHHQECNSLSQLRKCSQAKEKSPSLL